jgi:hypothetical protein
MTAPVRKALIGALAPWTFGAGVTMIPTPSLAQGWRGDWHGGYRGGWGGWGWRRGYYGAHLSRQESSAASLSVRLLEQPTPTVPITTADALGRTGRSTIAGAILRALPLLRSATELGLYRANWGNAPLASGA